MNPETFNFLEKSVYNTSNDGWVDVSSYDINYIDDKTKDAVAKMYKDFFSDDIYKSPIKWDDHHAVGDLVWFEGNYIAVISGVGNDSYSIVVIYDHPYSIGQAGRYSITTSPDLNNKAMITAVISELEDAGGYFLGVANILSQRLSTM